MRGYCKRRVHFVERLVRAPDPCKVLTACNGTFLFYIHDLKSYFMLWVSLFKDKDNPSLRIIDPCSESIIFIVKIRLVVGL